MQPKESDSEIFIVIVNEAYGDDEEFYEEDADKFHIDIQSEFKVRFDEVNIGPGADILGFITILSATKIPLWGVLLAAFFLGKAINENLDAWREIIRKIRSFFKYSVVLSRHGAAVIAVETVFNEIGATPKSVQLLSYRIIDYYEKLPLAQFERSCEIEPTPETCFLGAVCHIFELEADGQRYRVCIDGKKSEIMRIE